MRRKKKLARKPSKDSRRVVPGRKYLYKYPKFRFADPHHFGKLVHPALFNVYTGGYWGLDNTTTLGLNKRIRYYIKLIRNSQMECINYKLETGYSLDHINDCGDTHYYLIYLLGQLGKWKLAKLVFLRMMS
jgi:hypothetical protein